LTKTPLPNSKNWVLIEKCIPPPKPPALADQASPTVIVYFHCSLFSATSSLLIALGRMEAAVSNALGEVLRLFNLRPRPVPCRGGAKLQSLKLAWMPILSKNGGNSQLAD
jgi:hypothetical protein